MGLIQSRANAPARRAMLVHWLLPAAVVLLAGVIALLGEPATTLLRFDRGSIEQGQWWRLLSGHLAHLSVPHFALNAAGLVLVWVLVGHVLKPLQWLLAFVAMLLAIDAAFWFVDTRLQWYVGLSGVLHGLLLCGLLLDWRRARLENSVVAAAVFAKLIYEQTLGALPGSAETAGGPVVVNAHLYGAVAGAALAAAILLGGRMRQAG